MHPTTDDSRVGPIRPHCDVIIDAMTCTGISPPTEALGGPIVQPVQMQSGGEWVVGGSHRSDTEMTAAESFKMFGQGKIRLAEVEKFVYR